MKGASTGRSWTVVATAIGSVVLSFGTLSPFQQGIAADAPRSPQDSRFESLEQSMTDNDPTAADDDEFKVVPAAAWQPPLMPAPRLQNNVPLPAAAAEVARRRNFASSRETARTTLKPRESTARGTTDAADMLRKSPSAISTGVQRRSPIVNDPRVQGSRVGQLPTVGSYWLPARIDLDTVLSKFDSRILEEFSIIPGPFSASHGPGFHFMETRLRDASRFDDGQETHAASTLEYQANGAQWHGRQELWTGDENWGVRAGYSQRGGDDYQSGNGSRIPSGYQSGTGDFAAGFNLDSDSRIDVHYLRLDQRRVDLPGQAFNINSLVTDGVDVVYRNDAPAWCDQITLEGWYNRTKLSGDSNNTTTPLFLPILKVIDFALQTDVDSMSTGARFAMTWGEEGHLQSTLGANATHVRQELNEFVTFMTNASFKGNSPIPRSGQTDVGLFWEMSEPISERFVLNAGARADFISSEVLEDSANLAHLQTPPGTNDSLASLLGTPQFNRDFFPWLAYLTGDLALNDEWTLTCGVGHGERPPSLTELYAAAPFMFLVQNGLNSITGDPELRPERMTQLHLALRVESERSRGRVRAFHSWVQDAITFEAAGLFSIQGPADSLQLRYVNTDLATLSGAEAFGEFDVNDWWTPFASIAYTQGTDRTRNGHFATKLATSTSDTKKEPGIRGDSGPTTGGSHEPLPGILPLESRIGVRWHSSGPQPKWSLELLARIVAEQDRVALSLLESTTAGFTTWHVRGRWQANRHCLLFAGVENFTNKQYREHQDFRPVGPGFSVFQPGASFFAGTDLTW